MIGMEPLLFLGKRHTAIAKLVDLLRVQGAWDDEAPELFDAELEHQVKYFQETHLGPDGRFLIADGIVGPKTWWALVNATGPAQRSGLNPTIPTGLGPLRTRILEIALAEHAKNVREEPDGSNRGPEIDQYLPEWRRRPGPGPAWCCFYFSWVVKEALGSYPLGSREGSCKRARARAVERDLWIPKMPRNPPMPGDAFVMDHGGRTGHIGFVLRVNKDATQINTVEGNCGNRVKVGLRQLSDPTLVGYIDNVPSEKAAFELGVVAVVAAVDSEPTR